MVRLGGFAKCISEPLGIVVRMSTEQIVKSFHMLRSRARLPDSHEFTSSYLRAMAARTTGVDLAESRGSAGESQTHSCPRHAATSITASIWLRQ